MLPPSTTTPSLAAGDPVRNALLTLATQLNRVQAIPFLYQYPAPVASSRVKPTMTPTHIAPPAPLPRVKIHQPTSPTYTTASTLQHHSKVTQNVCFDNKKEHRYPL